MEKDNIQKELFEFDAPRRQPNRFGRFFQRTDFAVSLSAERLIFVSIGVIMLLVVSFALGVERGKASAAKTVRISPAIAQAVPAQRPAAAVTIQQPVQAKTAVKAPVKAVAVKPAQNTMPYTIVVAAFSKEATAVKEVGRIKISGLEAFVYNSEPYYLVCVGSFANKENAQRTLNKVKQMHRDAYVRLK
ncbi:MAG: SPOR domain-containing protein [Candidatus Omnitrophota bacterium]|nr:SPOR domain-containing protein [Candidatus Omnitrophota bacterium]